MHAGKPCRCTHRGVLPKQQLLVIVVGQVIRALLRWHMRWLMLITVLTIMSTNYLRVLLQMRWSFLFLLHRHMFCLSLHRHHALVDACLSHLVAMGCQRSTVDPAHFVGGAEGENNGLGAEEIPAEFARRLKINYPDMSAQEHPNFGTGLQAEN